MIRQMQQIAVSDPVIRLSTATTVPPSRIQPVA